jgi:hypothetical protein
MTLENKLNFSAKTKHPTWDRNIPTNQFNDEPSDPTRNIVQRALISAGFHRSVLFIHPRDPGPDPVSPWPFWPMNPGDLAFYFYVTGLQHLPAHRVQWLHSAQDRRLPPPEYRSL